MYIYTILLRMTDTMTSQNIDLSSWDILYNVFLLRSDLSISVSLRVYKISIDNRIVSVLKVCQNETFTQDLRESTIQ